MTSTQPAEEDPQLSFAPCSFAPRDPSAERLRNQELARFFASAGVRIRDPNSGDAPSAPSLAPDPTLTALGQLGPLRLNCDRAFASLIDADTQYIIVEATRTLSYRQEGRHAENDGLYLGLQALQKGWGVCPNTITVFTDPTGESNVDSQNIAASQSRYIIRDFLADPHYATRPYVKEWPYMRSYLEVPLTTAAGYVIGSYCVVDNKLRPDFDEEETLFVMNEIAMCIVDHLELLKARLFRDRAERLMKGLGSFVQNKTFDLDPGYIQNAGDGAPHKPSISSSSSAPTLVTVTSGETVSDDRSQVTPEQVSTPSEVGKAKESLENYVVTTSEIPQKVHIMEPVDSSELHAENGPKQAGVPYQIRSAFSRACGHIRKAMELDGIVFVDACSVEVKAATESHIYSGFSDVKDLDDLTTKEASVEANTRSGKALATLLAHSTRADIDVRAYVHRKSIPEALLSRLIAEYPSGQAFTPFDKWSSGDPEDVADNVSPSEEVQPPKWPDSAGGSSSAKAKCATDLFDVFSSASCLIFLPLWDFNKNRWFAGALAWSNDPVRTFDKEDISYVSAFGNSIMNEVWRTEAQAISNAKSDFISSVSHELRSPLHGILASSDLLRESMTDVNQLSTLQMIQICGNNLLDTMTHLLDYAKINNLTSGKSKGNMTQSGNKDHIHSTSDVDLSSLIQDVVDGTHRGHTANLDHLSHGDTITMSAMRRDDVLVTLDVENRDWNMDTSIGAWKRIIMNVFSNALKYTDRGWIQLALRVIDNPDSSDDSKDQRFISFSIKDSGRGISSSFLKYQLFQPFQQVDNLSPGTGLGLSIVHQIVQSIGGNISVQSDVGVGTCIEVLVPIPPQLEVDASPALAQSITGVPAFNADRLFAGRKVCLVAFDTLPDLTETPSGVLSPQAQQTICSKTWISKIACDWFGMDVTVVSSPKTSGVDLHVIEERSLDTFDKPAHDVNPEGRSTAPVLVICSGARQPPKLTSSSGYRCVFLNHPLTPRKLKVALEECFAVIDSPAGPLFEHTQNGDSKPQMSPAIPRRVEKKADADLMELSTTPPSPRAPIALPALSKAPVSPHSALSMHHVLLVDDNAINLRILVTCIGKVGCTYATASDGLQAFNTFKSSSRRFSLVFMDISMPVMDGFESTRLIRKFEQENWPGEKRAKIIALTGLGSEASQKEAETSGLDVFLTKPVSLKKVKSMLVEGVND
ncbi:hypothetical protein K402DRAFT_422438 [Aulographum hederae CBS 113979]|uniref:Uncharacterized protein n=1 Tax=Aulographum hederae CBS 113979 TaxID=1176131 RepID=A0A6G1GWH4_9PEZI|nr:hypothetical protein K402DRAFT_422438 [Aulographum hederae CBS 113979]